MNLSEMENVGTSAGFCANTADVWQLIGVALLIFKIVIPIILIILGMIDLGKAVVSSDDKAISKSTKSLAMRIVAAIIIFFIPSIISFVFSIIGTFNDDVKDDFEVCKKCIVSPNKEGGNAENPTCKYYVSEYVG